MTFQHIALSTFYHVLFSIVSLLESSAIISIQTESGLYANLLRPTEQQLNIFINNIMIVYPKFKTSLKPFEFCIAMALNFYCNKTTADFTFFIQITLCSLQNVKVFWQNILTCYQGVLFWLLQCRRHEAHFVLRGIISSKK